MPKKAKSTKAVKKPTTQKLQAIKKPYTKSQLVQHIANDVDIGKKNVVEVLDVLDRIISAHLCKNGAGIFNFIGIAKFKTKNMPAQKARKGRNPFTGEEVMFKAKPARNVVKVRPLKKLKDTVNK